MWCSKKLKPKFSAKGHRRRLANSRSFFTHFAAAFEIFYVARKAAILMCATCFQYILWRKSAFNAFSRNIFSSHQSSCCWVILCRAGCDASSFLLDVLTAPRMSDWGLMSGFALEATLHSIHIYLEQHTKAEKYTKLSLKLFMKLSHFTAKKAEMSNISDIFSLYFQSRADSLTPILSFAEVSLTQCSSLFWTGFFHLCPQLRRYVLPS